MNMTKRYIGLRSANEVAGLVTRVLGTLALASAVTCAAPAASSTAGGTLTSGALVSVAAGDAPDPDDATQAWDSNGGADRKPSSRRDYESGQVSRR